MNILVITHTETNRDATEIASLFLFSPFINVKNSKNALFSNRIKSIKLLLPYNQYNTTS
jgi:hypothetical protein